MGHETSKCLLKRQKRGDFRRYLHGNGIDIGAGDDPLIVESGSVWAYDKFDGDANTLAGIPDSTFDFCYSSHCLEHMTNVPEALRHWVRVLKPGGYLYVVVPDFELYEKSTWPSRFNPDHKASFSLQWPSVNLRATHFVMADLMKWLDLELKVRPLELHRENDGFDPKRFDLDQTESRHGGALCQIYFVGVKRR